MKTYVIGDIAGQYDALMELVSKFEPNSRIILVGDIIDRGPKSKEVVDWAMTTPNVTTLMGNHEWMALNDTECWLDNGGTETCDSFGLKYAQRMYGHTFEDTWPKKYREWFESLPWRVEFKIDDRNYVVTHAPIPDPDGPKWSEEPVELWNRYDPAPIEGVDLQIFGHNAKCKLFMKDQGVGKSFKRDGFGGPQLEAPDVIGNLYGICIDDCGRYNLMAIELPTLKLIDVPLKPANR